MSSPKEEELVFAQKVQRLKEFFSRQRFRYLQRPYKAEDVASLSGSLIPKPLSNHTAQKLYNLLRVHFVNRKYIHTFGALDPIQVIQMAKYLPCVYVSGWQCSSTASTTNEPGPDFADYPSNTVCNKVEQLFKAQLYHDRKQYEERSRMTLEEKSNKKAIDYLRPIIADGDCGFGGITAIMKLTKLMIESGASGVHIEDQKAGTKKCGHLGGKVLVPLCEQINRLRAFRLQCDIMQTETVIVSRTDAVAANYIENDIDVRDHPFIAGTTDRDIVPFRLAKDKVQWLQNANLCRYQNAIAKQMQKDGKYVLAKEFVKSAMNLSHNKARQLAKELGYGNVFWCCEKARSNEGYYRIIGGVEMSIVRAIHCSDIADLIWMETSQANFEEAKLFAIGVHSVKPNQMLAYNLSPSFNWDASGMDDKAMMRFQEKLGKLGFVWQFITLAGFHLDALAVDKFAKEYSEKGVFKYVEMIQREERRLGVETLTHQKWSGTELQDRALNIATGGSSSTSSKHGSTEAQFTKSKL